jgi:hypothetical protein
MQQELRVGRLSKRFVSPGEGFVDKYSTGAQCVE